MALPMGHRTRRVQKPRGTIERTDARGSHGNPPSPQTHARAEDQRENNIDRWDDNDLARKFNRLQGLFSRAGEVTDEIVQWLNACGVDPFPGVARHSGRRRLGPSRLRPSIYVVAAGALHQSHLRSRLTTCAAALSHQERDVERRRISPAPRRMLGVALLANRERRPIWLDGTRPVARHARRACRRTRRIGLARVGRAAFCA